MTLPAASDFIAAGASAEVYRLGKGLVLKLFHAGIDQSIIDREYLTAQAIRDTGLPVARAIERRVCAGRQGIVYTEISGPSLLNYIKRHPYRAGWALGEMARLQQHIQAQHVPALRSTSATLAEDIAVSDLPDGLRAAAVERLDQLIEEDRLSHGDLHPANMIVTPTGLAVIDWSKAARGAPAADAVRTEMLMRFGTGLSMQWEGAVRDWLTAYYIRRYRRLTAMEPEALAAWRPLVALAWLRHRQPARDDAFTAYLERALRVAGLPALHD